MFCLMLFHSEVTSLTTLNIRIPMKDIAQTNVVVGMGTMLNKFGMDRQTHFGCHVCPITFLSVESRLFIPHIYHMLYLGHSVAQGNRVKMFVGKHRISISID